MRFTGILTWISTKQNGTSKSGNNWEKVDFTVTENAERYPNVMLFTAFNDKLQQFQGLNIGDMVEVDYDSRVRDWTDNNGNPRKSLELTLFRIQRPGQVPTQPTTPTPAPAPAQSINFNEPQDNDGLPF